MAKTKAEVQRDYRRAAHGKAQEAERRYREKVIKIGVTLRHDYDGDLIAALDPGQPLASQVKQLMRDGIAAKQNSG